MSKIHASQVRLKVSTTLRRTAVEVYLTRGTKEAFIGVEAGRWSRRSAEKHAREMTDEAKVQLAEVLFIDQIAGLKGTVESARQEMREAQKDLQVLLWVIGG